MNINSTVPIPLHPPHYDLFSPEEEQTVKVLVTISSTLSFFGCFFVIVSYVIFKQFGYFHMRLIFYLILSDLVTSIVATINTYTRAQATTTKLFCDSTAGILQFSLFSSLMWTGCIGHTLDQVIRKKNFSVEKYEILYHILCWGPSLGTVIYLWLTNRFGDAGLWCWINPEKSGLYRFAFFYGPLGIIFIYNGVVYCLVSWILNTENKKISRVIEEKKEHTIQTTFRWFLLAFFFCWLPAVANRIQNSLQPDRPLFWLYCLHGSFTPLQGFFDALIYGFNDELRRNYYALISRYCLCFFGKYEHISIQDEDAWYHDYRQKCNARI